MESCYLLVLPSVLLVPDVSALVQFFHPLFQSLTFSLAFQAAASARSCLIQPIPFTTRASLMPLVAMSLCPSLVTQRDGRRGKAPLADPGTHPGVQQHPTPPSPPAMAVTSLGENCQGGAECIFSFAVRV